MALGVVVLNAGSGGAEIVVDVIGGDAYEVIKLAWGSEGVATLVDAANPIPVTDAAALAALVSIAGEDFATQTTLAAINLKTPALGQAVMALSVPVVIASDQPAIAITAAALPLPSNAAQEAGGNLAAIAAATAASAISLAILDDWDESDRCKVNPIAGQAGVQGGSGGVSATTQRVVLATDVGLPAGTALLGITQTKDLPDASATYALSNATSTAYEASRVVKSSAGYLHMVTGYNSKTTTQFIMISNTTSVPADGQTPVVIFAVPPASNFSFDLGKYGRYFSTGICIFNSSTSPTKTLGSADCFFDVQYI